MKPIKNSIVIPKREVDSYFCRICGAREQGEALWSERTYGAASIVNEYMELDDYETTDSDHFEITGVRCMLCGEERDSFEELFTTEDPDAVEEEEE